MSTTSDTHSTSTKKPMLRKCDNCYVTSQEKQLFKCSRCRAQAYCSKECQKANWKKHKSTCNNNGLLESLLKQHESTPMGAIDRLLLVDGISLYELDQRLEKWVRFHTSTLMVATIQALGLVHDVSRARTGVLYVRLEARGAAEHDDAPGKFFRVVDAHVVSIAEAQRRPAPWPESVAQVQVLADSGERLGQGTTAAAMLECPPLAVQTVPFGSLSKASMRGEEILEDWKRLFMEHVERGMKPRVVRRPS